MFEALKEFFRNYTSPLKCGLITAITASALTSCTAVNSDTYTLRIGAGHPSGPAVYTTQLEKFFVPEVERRVAEETQYKVQFVEGYGGSIATVSETLESVQSGICLLYTSPSPRDRG